MERYVSLEVIDFFARKVKIVLLTLLIYAAMC